MGHAQQPWWRRRGPRIAVIGPWIWIGIRIGIGIGIRKVGIRYVRDTSDWVLGFRTEP